MIIVPLQAVPNQTLAISLNRQACSLAVRQNGKAIYFDLLVAQVPIVRTRICRDRCRLLLDAGYRGFQGDFAFVDTRGTDDPQYLGLGSRYVLLYIAPNE